LSAGPPKAIAPPAWWPLYCAIPAGRTSTSPPRNWESRSPASVLACWRARPGAVVFPAVLEARYAAPVSRTHRRNHHSGGAPHVSIHRSGGNGSEDACPPAR
jgi:hypothetical protein